MPPRRVELRPAARTDLTGIFDFSADAWGERKAERYTSQISKVIDQLAAGRRRGTSISAIRNGCFKFAVGTHFIIYEITPQSLVVVRILHQRMDIIAALTS